MHGTPNLILLLHINALLNQTVVGRGLKGNAEFCIMSFAIQAGSAFSSTWGRHRHNWKQLVVGNYVYHMVLIVSCLSSSIPHVFHHSA